MPQPIEDIAFAILSRDARVTSQVTNSDGSVRIYPGALPQSASYPAVRISPVTASPVEDMDGGNALENTSVQVDAYARTSSVAKSLADAIRKAMNDNRTTTILGTDISSITRTTGIAFVENPDEGTDQPLHRHMAEFSIWHQQNM